MAALKGLVMKFTCTVLGGGASGSVGRGLPRHGEASSARATLAAGALLALAMLLLSERSWKHHHVLLPLAVLAIAFAALAALVGGLASLFYNPLALSAHILSSAEEARIYERGGKKARVGKSGSWMRLNQKNGDVIIRSEVEQNAGARLTNVIVYRFDAKGEMIERIDAKTAVFVVSEQRGNFYRLEDLLSTRPGQESVKEDQAILPVEISKSQLQANQSAANRVGFWELKEQARRVELAGKNPLPFLTRYQALLAVPLLFVAKVVQ